MVYNQSHVKMVTFAEDIRRHKKKSSAGEVRLVIRIQLPFKVEETFTEEDGHAGFQLLQIDTFLLMYTETMGLWKNYKATEEVKCRKFQISGDWRQLKS